MDTALYLNGIPFEKYIARFFEMRGLGSQYEHNNFNPSIYPNDNHNVVDGVIRDKTLIECTNPKETTFLNDKIMLNKLDYFKRKDPFHKLLWVLVVSFALFSDFIKQQIKKLGIVLIEVGVHADTTNRATFIRHLFKSKLYSLAQRLKPRKRKISGPSSTSLTTLDQYSGPREPTAIAILNHLHQHQSTPEKATETAPKTRFEPRGRFDTKPRFNG
ncbi:MAG: hypothetical protein ABSB89_11015 [Candidatus Bathyarchaeia archaeon]|jgi:hypothetical protein